jgi:hypothetical protein
MYANSAVRMQSLPWSRSVQFIRLFLRLINEGSFVEVYEIKFVRLKY